MRASSAVLSSCLIDDNREVGAGLWRRCVNVAMVGPNKRLEEAMGRKLETVLDGLAFPEGPRWHDGRLWFSDWGAGEIIAVDLQGRSEIILRMNSFPFSIDWATDPDSVLIHVQLPHAVLQIEAPRRSAVPQCEVRRVASGRRRRG